nr:MAG TPA: Hemin-degrading protein [Caudoviricetes sp.]
MAKMKIVKTSESIEVYDREGRLRVRIGVC